MSHVMKFVVFAAKFALATIFTRFVFRQMLAPSSK